MRAIYLEGIATGNATLPARSAAMVQQETRRTNKLTLQDYLDTVGSIAVAPTMPLSRRLPT